MQLNKLLLVFGAAACFVLADGLSAKWGKGSNYLFLLCAFAIGSFGYFIFGYLNRNTSLGVSSALVNLILVIGALAISYFYFNETLAPRQIAGIALACVAIFLMN